MALSKYKSVIAKVKILIDGYMREQQELLIQNKTYYNIPQLINQICAILYFEIDDWDNLNVGALTKRAINNFGLPTMMEIQYKTIPCALLGKDAAIAAKTGSGKSLAMIIPCVEILARNNWNKSMGTGAIIVVPTRELAIAINGVTQQMAQFHRTIRVGKCIGGSSRQAEAQMLKMGIGIVIATPGRLMDHLENTSFRFDLLKLLCIDEADHILDIGFEYQIHAILQCLPSTRQTLLFSATLTEKTKDLITKVFPTKPLFIKADRKKKSVHKLIQHYCVVSQDKKLPALLTWLRNHKNLKVLIFFSTKQAVKFHEKLFRTIGITVSAMIDANVFSQFVEAEKGILLATDIASRGMDFSAVDWVVQYDPSSDPSKHIDEVGLKCQALTFLQPTELAYLELLKEFGYSFNTVDIMKEVRHIWLKQKLSDVINSNDELKQCAIDAVRAFVSSYNQRANTVFNNNGVNKNDAAISFCLDKWLVNY